MKDLVKLMKDLNERIANFFGYTTKPDTRIYRRCAKCGLGTKEVPCDRCGDPREKGVTGFFPSEDEVELFEVVAFTHKMKEDRQEVCNSVLRVYESA